MSTTSRHNGWSRANVELMLGLKTSCGILSYRYEKASQWYYKAHIFISVPMIIMLSIVGSTMFTTLSDSCGGVSPYSLAAGGVNILSAILVAINTFMDFRAKGVLCKASYTGFMKLNNDILRMLMLKPRYRVPYSKFSTEVFTTYNELLNGAPTLLQRFKDLVYKAKQTDENIDLDGYCVYVQNKRHGVGGGLTLDGTTAGDRVRALNTKMSTVGLESMGSRTLRSMIDTDSSTASDGSDLTKGGLHVKIEE